MALYYIALAVTAVLVLRYVYFQLTVGARRRRMIRENGCRPINRYPHKGVLGKLFGWDVIVEMIKTGKEGRLHEAARLRNFINGITTLVIRLTGRDFIITIEPENVKTILSVKFNDYNLGQMRKEIFIPLFGHGIFDTDGPAWERSRALIRPNFVRQQVADLDMFEVHVQHLISAIPKDGSTVDLQDLFYALTMDSATEFLFGRSTNTLDTRLETKSANEFVEAFVYATEAISKHFRAAGILWFIPDLKWRKSIKIIHNFADEIIQEAIRTRSSSVINQEKSSTSTSLDRSKRYTFLNELLKVTQDPYTVRSEILNVLLAGRDTTAGLLANTWHVLSKRPDIWAKLKKEVDTLNGEIPEYHTIKEMKYLRYLLNESLRLMPVVAANNREAVRDTVLPLGGGPDGRSPMLVEKGQIIGYSLWSMHRREDFYGPDALEFKPERWESLRPGWEYLPFNGGPRICIGQQYALLEASYVTVRLVQTFPKLESRDAREWKEWLTITMSSGVGCKVALFEQ